MDIGTAENLKTRLNAIEEVRTAEIVMRNEQGVSHISQTDDRFDPDSNRIEVMFTAYDALIPAAVVTAIGEFDENLGIYDAPDCFVTETE